LVVERRLGVAVDIGATRVRVCLGDETGRLIWRKSGVLPAPPRVGDYVQALVSRVREGVDQVPRGRSIEGIGVASIGPLNIERGGMASPTNLPYDFVSIVKPMEDAFGAKVTLMNDARAGALGEREFGAGRGHDNLVYITISTGIGGGAIVDGHLLQGKNGNAGEVGHLVVDPRGRLICGCGRKGHWEAYCSGRNLPKLAALVAEELKAGGQEDAALAEGAELLDSVSILDAATKGHAFASRVAKEMGRLNAVGVAAVADAYDPSLITIGGGVALNNRRLVLDPIRQLLPKYAVNEVPEIITTPLGDDAGLLGALSLALRGS
jgi:glucokinase